MLTASELNYRSSLLVSNGCCEHHDSRLRMTLCDRCERWERISKQEFAGGRREDAESHEQGLHANLEWARGVDGRAVRVLIYKPPGESNHAHAIGFGKRTKRQTNDAKFRLENILPMTARLHAVVDD